MPDPIDEGRLRDILALLPIRALTPVQIDGRSPGLYVEPEHRWVATFKRRTERDAVLELLHALPALLDEREALGKVAHAASVLTATTGGWFGDQGVARVQAVDVLDAALDEYEALTPPRAAGRKERG